MMPSLMPTERMLKNTKAFLAENPDSADLYYTIARIHYLTFTNKMWLVQGWESSSSSRVAPDFLISYGASTVAKARREEAERRVATKINKKENKQEFYEAVNTEEGRLKEENWQPKPLTSAEIVQQAGKAAAAFGKAIELDPENGLYLLGRASLQEQASDFLAKNPTLQPKQGLLADLSPEVLLTSYCRALKAAREKDLQQEFLPASGLKSMVTYEAATAILRLSEQHPDTAKKVDGLQITQVKKDLKNLKKLKTGAITPILIADDPRLPVSGLVRRSPVRFDVDGDGRKEKLDSWPNEKAGILVWDPSGSGEVHSGQQWFGTFGFNMLWRDGYQAMNALDDSRDGWLSDDELTGISIWRDANGNAISDPGEVRSVESCGIAAIAVTPEPGHSLRNREGVRLANGTITASHDWIFQLLE